MLSPEALLALWPVTPLSQSPHNEDKENKEDKEGCHRDIKVPCLVGIRSILVQKNKPNFWGNLKPRDKLASTSTCILAIPGPSLPRTGILDLWLLSPGAPIPPLSPAPLLQRAEAGHKTIGSSESSLLGLVGGDVQLGDMWSAPVRHQGAPKKVRGQEETNDNQICACAHTCVKTSPPYPG